MQHFAEIRLSSRVDLFHHAHQIPQMRRIVTRAHQLPYLVVECRQTDTIALTDVLMSPKKIVSISFNWGGGAAPTTAEDITVVLDSAAGAAYDVPLRTMDPSTFGGGTKDWLWNVADDLGSDFIISKDDHVAIAYANTDDLAIGVVLTMEEVG